MWWTASSFRVEVPTYAALLPIAASPVLVSVADGIVPLYVELLECLQAMPS
jgi:hypothetical protein